MNACVSEPIFLPRAAFSSSEHDSVNNGIPPATLINPTAFKTSLLLARKSLLDNLFGSYS